MSTKHTPGPWAVIDGKTPVEEHRSESGDGLAETLFIDGERGPVAEMTLSYVPLRQEFYRLSDNARADARLIAAAPDLLEALQALIPWAAKGAEGHQNHMIGERTIRNAQSAIDKATK